MKTNFSIKTDSFLLHSIKTFVLILFLFSSPVTAGTTYSLNGMLTAWFPNKPIGQQVPHGEEGRASQLFLSEDRQTSIIYFGGHTVGRKFTNKGGYPLRAYVDGIAETTPGTVISYRRTTVDGHDSAMFTIYMPSQGLTTAWIYGVVSFAHGQFLVWGVKEVVGMTTESARDMFKRYYRYYSIS